MGSTAVAADLSNPSPLLERQKHCAWPLAAATVKPFALVCPDPRDRGPGQILEDASSPLGSGVSWRGRRSMSQSSQVQSHFEKNRPWCSQSNPQG